MAIPMLLVVTLGLIWLLTLGTAQVRLVDATREAARALARGDTQADALDRARAVAPQGTELSVTADDELVRVTAKVRAEGIGGLFEALPSVQLTADATAAREQPP